MTDSPQSFRSRATVAIEPLKHARTEWVTRPALAKALGEYGLAAVWGGRA